MVKTPPLLLPGPKPEKPPKYLYFDIDGTFLDYDDEPKPALLDGRLEGALKAAGFDRLFCVSGWSDMVAVSKPRQRTYEEQKQAIWNLLTPLFHDREWFLEKLTLVYDTDRRCEKISLQADWYYVDDWADKFFMEAHGRTLFEKYNRNRILEADHKGDGKDILEWLGYVARLPFDP